MLISLLRYAVLPRRVIFAEIYMIENGTLSCIGEGPLNGEDDKPGMTLPGDVTRSVDLA